MLSGALDVGVDKDKLVSLFQEGSQRKAAGLLPKLTPAPSVVAAGATSAAKSPTAIGDEVDLDKVQAAAMVSFPAVPSKGDVENVSKKANVTSASEKEAVAD